MKRFFIKHLVLFLCVCPLFAQKITAVNEGAKKFEFKYRENDAYRILSTVEEDVFVNRIKHHTSEILNRVSVKVTSVDEKNMTAVHSGTFMTSENSVFANTLGNKTFSYGEEYTSVFTRDRFGVYTIDDKYFMPVVRDVPVFPDREIEPGETWTYKGHEAHDLRRTFNMEKPYKVPFTANYEYLGVVTENDRKFDVFQIYYEMSFSLNTAGMTQAGEMPMKTTGFSSQLVFWDSDKGAIDHYSESFRIEITTNYGNVMTFTGTAHAEITEFQRTATQQNVEEVTKKISDLGINDVNVKSTEKGLVLSIENIQFKADSDILLESEKLKLNKIAEIISNYPNNDLLITGHTALRGDEKSRQELSEKRAESVAQYLIQLGVKDNYHIFTQGKGAKEPVASNNTESGRSKNRRVEITILD